MQIIVTILFLYVFTLLAITLTIYLAVTFYRFFKPDKPTTKDKEA